MEISLSFVVCLKKVVRWENYDIFLYEKYILGLEVVVDLIGEIWVVLNIYLGIVV